LERLALQRFPSAAARHVCAAKRSHRALPDAPPANAQNRRNTPGRIELIKYNKYLRRHTLHREIKK